MSYIVLPASIAKDAMLFVSTEETRYYLNGFHLSRQSDCSLHVVSTDGHRMGMFRVDADNCRWPDGQESVIVRLSSNLQKQCKAPKRSQFQSWLRIGTVTGACEIVMGATADDAHDAQGSSIMAGESTSSIVDGVYPNYQSIIPQGMPSPLMGECYNGRYFADFAKLSDSGAMQVWSQGIAHPGIVTLPQRPDFLGVIMPMRNGIDAAFTDAVDWRGAILGINHAVDRAIAA